MAPFCQRRPGLRPIVLMMPARRRSQGAQAPAPQLIERHWDLLQIPPPRHLPDLIHLVLKTEIGRDLPCLRESIPALLMAKGDPVEETELAEGADGEAGGLCAALLLDSRCEKSFG